VRGVRADGTANLSHAWARTVDGAEGGTWDHVHLLGTAALDAYRGYTGQSHSRRPTHTWNTSLVDDGDHGGRLADQRTAREQVLAALARRTPRWPPSMTRGPSTADYGTSSPPTRPSSTSGHPIAAENSPKPARPPPTLATTSVTSNAAWLRSPPTSTPPDRSSA
jgi:hypothetical protein